VDLKFSLVFLIAFGAGAQTLPAQTLPDAPGKDAFQMVCSMCHSPNAVIGKQGTKQWWQSKVTEMLQEETDIPSSDVDTIVNYLATNFPIVKINVNKASAKDLESGLELSAKASEAIVAYRAAKGSFKTMDDLKKVPGLDATEIESKKDRLQF
jgi:competence protein ComEA